MSLNGDVWVVTMKDRMTTLIADLGAALVPTLGKKIQKRGLTQDQYHAGQMEMLSVNPDFRKIFGNADKPLNPELMNLLQTQATQLVLSSASAAIDAASLVFAQSIVDAAARS